jgi:hypothetical protein
MNVVDSGVPAGGDAVERGEHIDTDNLRQFTTVKGCAQYSNLEDEVEFVIIRDRFRFMQL